MKTAKTLITIIVCIFTGVVASAQSDTTDTEQLRQQIEQLQKLLELKERQAAKPPAPFGCQPSGVAREYAPAAQAQQTQQAQPTQQSGRQPGPVTLRPVDTGRNVVTFNLGGDRSATPGRFLLKTNLAGIAGQSANLSAEYGLGGRTSVEATVGYNDWHNLWDNAALKPAEDNYRRRLDHLLLKAEFRYWLGERFRGHFFGAGALFADYSVGQMDVPLLFEKTYQYDGMAYGGALTYGYLWRLSRRWGVEFSVSGGLVRLRYDKSVIDNQTDSYRLVEARTFAKTYLGPTAVGIKLVFTID